MTRDLRLYGHRGAAADRPENTVPSFARALELGVDALETDVHLTADGHVVVCHDPHGGRVAGVRKEIRAVTLAELRRWDAGWGYIDSRGARPFAGRGIGIPTLHELLDLAGDVRINVDIKQRRPSMVAALLELLRRRRCEERITVASFHAEVMREVRELGFRGETVLGRAEVLALALVPGRSQGVRDASLGHAVQVPLSAGPLALASPRFIAKCHALGLRVDYWTVDDPVVAEVLLDRGADGVMSDDPAALVPVFARQRGRLGKLAG